MTRTTNYEAPRASRTASRAFGVAANYRAVFLVILAVPLFYAAALLAVVYLYRRGYGIVGKPELAFRSIATNLGRLRSRARDQRMGTAHRPIRAPNAPCP